MKKRAQKLKSYTLSFDYWNYSTTVYAFTAAKAKYNYYLEFRDCFDLSFFEFLKCFKIKSNKTWDNNEEKLEHVRKHRNLPFIYIGMKVKLDEKIGYIVGGNSSLNIDVLFENEDYKSNCHPHSGLEYFDHNDNLIKSYK